MCRWYSITLPGTRYLTGVPCMLRTISIIELFEPKSRKVKDKQSHVVYSLPTSEPGVQVQVAFLKKLFLLFIRTDCQVWYATIAAPTYDSESKPEGADVVDDSSSTSLLKPFKTGSHCMHHEQKIEWVWSLLLWKWCILLIATFL